MTDRAVEAALAALPTAGGAVEVVGEGGLARTLRRRLGLGAPDPLVRPSAIIETTGDHDAVQQALRRVADLGTVVLAGPPPAAAVALDLYADLHVRGLTLVGTPGPATTTAP